MAVFKSETGVVPGCESFDGSNARLKVRFGGRCEEKQLQRTKTLSRNDLRFDGRESQIPCMRGRITEFCKIKQIIYFNQESNNQLD